MDIIALSVLCLVLWRINLNKLMLGLTPQELQDQDLIELRYCVISSNGFYYCVMQRNVHTRTVVVL
jgi:hypothetical protein